MDDPGRFRLVLAKQDFKFSVAHFTVFGDGDAELLHGHNYRVTAELFGRELDEYGLLANIAEVKAVIRRLVAELDSRVLLPAASPLVRWRRPGDDPESLEVEFDSRRYRFPAEEVVLLPLANTTIELFAVYFWERLTENLALPRIDRVSVSVQETAGQRCVYERDLEA